MNSAEPTWVAAEQPPVPEPSPPNGERVSNPTANVKEEDGKTPLPVDAHQLFFFFLALFTSGRRGRVQIGVTQETACLVLSGLIQINPLLQGGGTPPQPQSIVHPSLSGYRA